MRRMTGRREYWRLLWPRIRHKYRHVPLTTALALVRAADPGRYWKENIERQFRDSAQVRGRYFTERTILMEMAKALERMELIG